MVIVPNARPEPYQQFEIGRTVSNIEKSRAFHVTETLRAERGGTTGAAPTRQSQVGA